MWSSWRGKNSEFYENFGGKSDDIIEINIIF